MSDADLFSYSARATYPHTPGTKRFPGPSADAAASMAPKAKPLRIRCLEALRANPGGLTADEIARRLGVTVLALRPRVSESLALGLIFDSGITRPNISGLQASVWKIVP